MAAVKTRHRERFFFTTVREKEGGRKQRNMWGALGLAGSLPPQLCHLARTLFSTIDMAPGPARSQVADFSRFGVPICSREHSSSTDLRPPQSRAHFRILGLVRAAS